MPKTRRKSEYQGIKQPAAKQPAAKRHGVAEQGQCRIIAGKWRGRKIKFYDAEGLRPTTDRIRETVFNWLQIYLPDSNCLDCFAGSGVLGFEALSRGADKVVFIEQNKTTSATLKDNAKMLDADNAVIVHDDALHWLENKQAELKQAEPYQISSGGRLFIAREFNLVFLDPPFHSSILKDVCILLDRSGCLAEDALIYVEHAVDSDVVLPVNWVCLKQKQSGQVVYKLFQNKISSEDNDDER